MNSTVDPFFSDGIYTSILSKLGIFVQVKQNSDAWDKRYW